MAIEIQIRRDLAATWTADNPVLDQGELALETDTRKVKIGDGVTAWTTLAYWSQVIQNTDGTLTVTTSGGITTIGTANSGVTPGSYTNATVTVDVHGRVTGASSGVGGGVTSFAGRSGGVTPQTGDYTAAQVTGAESTANKGAAGGYPSLDGGGHVPTAQLPAITMNTVWANIASQAAMLALAAEPGDVAVRTDISANFMLSALPAATLGNWVQLADVASPVTSVAGRTGAVSLANTDISGLGTASTHAATDFVPTAFLPGTGGSGAPTTGTWVAGQLAVDSTDRTWICTASGTPGTWQQAGAYVAASDTGAWQSTHAYTVGQSFTNAGTRYVVITAYTSGGSFGATDTANTMTFGGSGSSLITPNPQSGATYTLVLTDSGECVEMTSNSANTVTVPPNASVAFPVGTPVEVMQYGAGQTTIAAGAGVTIDAPGGRNRIAVQYGSCSLRKRATNEWALEGDLTLSTVFSPLNLAGLFVWWDLSDSTTLFQDTGGATPIGASGNTIGRVNDKSGAGNLLTQATAGSRPTYTTGVQNGLSAAVFNGTNSVLTNLSLPVSLNIFTNTIFVVTSRTLAASECVFDWRGAGGTPIYAFQTDGSSNWQVQARNDTASLATETSTDHTTTACTIYSMSSNTFNFRENGGAALVGPAVMFGGTGLTITNMIVGSSSNGSGGVGTHFYPGNIMEVIGTTSTLNNAQMDQVGNYLAAKWGLAWSPTV